MPFRSNAEVVAGLRRNRAALDAAFEAAFEAAGDAAEIDEENGDTIVPTSLVPDFYRYFMHSRVRSATRICQDRVGNYQLEIDGSWLSLSIVHD